MLGDIKELKQFVFDILSAKAFRNDQITITWYVNKKTLLFQGQMGNTLKAQIVNLHRTECMALDVETEEGDLGILRIFHRLN